MSIQRGRELRQRNGTLGKFDTETGGVPQQGRRSTDRVRPGSAEQDLGVSMGIPGCTRADKDAPARMGAGGGCGFIPPGVVRR